MVHKKRRDISTIAKGVVTGVIITAMLIIAGLTIFHVFHTPESNTKSKIESIAADYYENYFYKNILNNIADKSSLATVLSKYEKTGFSRVSLRQLLLYDNKKHNSEAPELKKYCDESMTSIQIFPDPPYSSKDYHVSYYYSCEF